jgi:hypothetical protein
MTLSDWEEAERLRGKEFAKHETENFTSLESELWWFVRNCSEDNFHEPLESTTELTKELLAIIHKWKLDK